MLPRDYEPSIDPQVYLDQLDAWENRQTELIGQQTARAAGLVAAQARLETVEGFLASLGAVESATAGQGVRLTANTAQRAAIAAELESVAGVAADHEAAREPATARLLGGPGTAESLLLLPLRLETRWLDGALHVRIYPDEIGLDRHDPTLTSDEVTWARHFWEVRAGAAAGDPEETWQQLVRRFGPTRAGWLVRATRPGQPDPAERSVPWPSPAQARLLPDRFAVVAFAAGLPLNVAPASEPPRYVTWSAPVTESLTLSVFENDSAGTLWWRDLEAARNAGMAVSLSPAPGAPPIEALAVVGTRSAATGGALSDLLTAHSVTSAVQLLTDGTPTNNSSTLRSAYGPEGQENAARAVRDAAVGEPPVLAATTAGARLAGLLGVPRDIMAVLPGATTDRDTVAAAARLLVGLGVRGALRQQLGATAEAAWSLVEPAGPMAPVRIGRQPYGVLPVTAPGRWRPRAGEASTGLAGAMRQWAAATGPPVRTDPAHPPAPPTGGAARRVRPDNDSELPVLLLESASSVGWTGIPGAAGAAPSPDVDGIDALVGAAGGESSPATALALLAATAPADLAALSAATRTGSLLTRIAVAAKRTARAEQVDAVNAALLALAGTGRDRLARTVSEFLDAASHRFDAWVTAAATERAVALRGTSTQEIALGAFGWLTEVAPRTAPRSSGHVHAPSLAQAATAAVLRSAFLGERRRAWAVEVSRLDVELTELLMELESARGDPREVRILASRIAATRRKRDRARADRDRGAPLDAATERRLPLAVDLSSRRVRGALWVLSAVRAGQPLGAVLGYQFERDLGDADLMRYLFAFRKLTRFPTGTALDAVEQKRSDRRSELAAMRAEFARRQATAAGLVEPLTRSRQAEQAAAERNRRANEAYQPYRVVEAELEAGTATVVRLEAELIAIDAAKPRPASTPFHVTLP